MTDQEKKFADEYVMLFFHSSTSTLKMMVNAARYAGYELSADCIKAELFSRDLLERKDINEYVKAEIASFRAKLSGSQRRNLWNLISNMTIGEPDENGTYTVIIPH